jgi:hypothetical protein
LISCHPRYLVCGLTSENEAGGLRSKQPTTCNLGERNECSPRLL